MQVKLEQLKKLVAKLPEKKISQSVLVIIVIYLAFLVAKLVWLVVPTPAKGPVISPPQASLSSSTSAFNSRSVTDQNLFGSVSAKPVVKVEQPKVINNAPETRLSISLTGVVAVNLDDQAGLAIIESQGAQETYQSGDVVKGTRAQVKQVFADRVILQVNSGFETLMLDGIEFSKTLASTRHQDAPRSRLTPVEDDDMRVIEPTEDEGVQDELRETRDEILDEPGKLFEYLQVSPERNGGELVGYRLRPGKDPELFNRMGLQANDLATSINGYALTDMKQAMTAINELRSATSASITIERDGEQIDVQFSLE